VAGIRLPLYAASTYSTLYTHLPPKLLYELTEAVVCAAACIYCDSRVVPCCLYILCITVYNAVRVYSVMHLYMCIMLYVCTALYTFIWV
jgi:hypothetical protein